MKKILFVFMAVVMSAMVFAKVECNDNAGAIWTTDSGCEKKNDNHYAVGEDVWLAGHKFCPGVDYDWSITGQPGKASCTPNVEVAGGLFGGVQEDGTFCVKVHTVTDEECGEYKVDFNGKKDNYRVDEPIPEFSLIAGGLALAGAGIGYAFLRRK